MRGESGRSYPPRVMVALRAPPPQSSEISGGFPVANCTGSMEKKKERSVEASLAECVIVLLFLNTWKLIYFYCHPVRGKQLLKKETKPKLTTKPPPLETQGKTIGF